MFLLVSLVAEVLMITHEQNILPESGSDLVTGWKMLVILLFLHHPVLPLPHGPPL